MSLNNMGFIIVTSILVKRAVHPREKYYYHHNQQEKEEAQQEKAKHQK